MLVRRRVRCSRWADDDRRLGGRQNRSCAPIARGATGQQDASMRCAMRAGSATDWKRGFVTCDECSVLVGVIVPARCVRAGCRDSGQASGNAN